MYSIKIQEGKDLPKDENVKLVFPSKFEGENPNTGGKYTKTSSLMCEITVPIYGMGKIMSMDSAFFCESGNPPLAQARCVWIIDHQEAKVLIERVPRGID